MKLGTYKTAKHQGSKRGYKHKKAEPSVKIVTIEATNDITGTTTKDNVRVYKHGRTFGMKLGTNHDRVTAGRILKEL